MSDNNCREVATRVLRVPTEATPDWPGLKEAGALIREGRLVAFPTETVYGLGANGLDTDAVRRIFAAKGRPADNPLILHVAGLDGLKQLARMLSATAERLAREFWPGPLTLVVPRADIVPDSVTAGLDTVAVRCPDHAVALALIRSATVPIAAPSANESGRPSPTRAEHVLADLRGRVDLVLDAGPTGIGLESTVVDVTGNRVLLLRPGGLPVEALEQVVGAVDVGGPGETHGAVRSPGMKYRHYAPSARVVLVALDSEDERRRRIEEESVRLSSTGKTVGLLCSAELAHLLDRQAVDNVYVLGARDDLPKVASHLFEGLRTLDDAGCDIILVEGFSREGYGLAIMDRLTRAADTLIT